MDKPSKLRSTITGVVTGTIVYAIGFLSATYASRGYVQRHFDQCYVRGSQDMKNAIFGAFERLDKAASHDHG